jgi:uncharacterized protein YcbX
VHVQELWRYPVKSMAGERLDAIEATLEGFEGDRLFQVRRGPMDRIVTSRTSPALLGLRATWDASGREPLVNGLPWRAPEIATLVRRAAGEGARIERGEAGRFDVLPLLIATDGAIRALGVDHRRLRPNIVVGGVDGLAERAWPGRLLRLGRSVLVQVAKLRQRCVMTTYDPDTQEQDVGVLRRIVEEFDGRIALDCAVVEAGRLRVGDPVELASA